MSQLCGLSDGHPEICVAILDGPVDLSHACFSGADLTVAETLATSQAGSGSSAHGTHIASLIFGQPGSPVRGIAPRCRGLILPVFAGREDGSLAPCSQGDLARALSEAVRLGAHVINISGGQLDPGGHAHPLLANAARLCAEGGGLIVAAAGNDGCDCLHVPAALPTVLAVGAMNAQGRPLAFSNWGGGYQSHGILAPGESIPGALPGGGTARRSGTSYAAAIVSGAAALLLSLQRQQGRCPDPSSVRRAILSSATGCENCSIADRHRLLVGRLNVNGAARLLTTGGPMELADSFAGPALPETPLCQVAPSGCGCGGACGCQGPALVFALGQLGYDFGSEARRDSLLQEGIGDPANHGELLAHLDAHPAHAPAVIWTLSQETTPIYALEPAGPFAAEIYERLREILKQQITEGVEQVAIPGRLAGQTRLMNGQRVPVIRPEIRGMYSWSTKALIEAVQASSHESREDDDSHRREADVSTFLERVYYEIRNLGLQPQERAINFTATNAFQVERVFQSAIEERLSLESIGVERSPVCRPESDCWDVKLTFFNPTRRLEQARVVYRFTVDVSDVVPVTVGRVRHWPTY